MVSRVLSRLDDMLAASAIVEMLVGEHAHRLPKIQMLALERTLEIISEASRHIPEDMKAEFPDLPWRKIAGLGNILRHDYQRLDPNVLIAIATDDLPVLRPALEQMLATLEGEA